MLNANILDMNDYAMRSFPDLCRQNNVFIEPSIYIHTYINVLNIYKIT